MSSEVFEADAVDSLADSSHRELEKMSSGDVEEVAIVWSRVLESCGLFTEAEREG